jgi:Kef-type K+ transport system membrane component KefB
MLALIATGTSVLEFLRAQVASLSPLARFAIALGAVLVMPPLCRRVKLPPIVGLLVAGIILGPFVLVFSFTFPDTLGTATHFLRVH